MGQSTSTTNDISITKGIPPTYVITEPPRWNTAWMAYDIDNCFYNYIVHGMRQVTARQFKHLMHFYEWQRAQPPPQPLPQKWIDESGPYGLFRMLDMCGAFNFLRSQFPVPAQLDPHCRVKGMATPELLKAELPPNFTLASGMFHVANSNVKAANTSIVGADIQVVFDKNRSSHTAAGPAQNPDTTPIVFFAPHRNMMHWGAPDEPQTGTDYFYTIVAVFVVLWLVLICCYYICSNNRWTIAGGTNNLLSFVPFLAPHC